MTPPHATCWTLIRSAANGDPTARERFARVYLPVVNAYLTARWRVGGREVDDAARDDFVECFKAGGVLARADAERPGGFRAFRFGAVRNVALRYDSRRKTDRLPTDLPADDPSLSRAFDRAWAVSMLKEAVRVQVAAADTPAARRRLELLSLRFQDGRPIREIAVQWKEDPAWLHHKYATARNEFQTALGSVVSFHYPDGSPAKIDAACKDLLGIVG